ncbi:hypothetical protein L596_001557 [Steinernema carpocapsae]|uniref:Uncharacterized protein n=1 Tax=Steinernema carpocapsae TaxID=34508 RepID=A0A4U8UP59_STECR|nr:hypothetical protein L596_001557 [Steinernema carpocapsae]
MKKRLVIAGMPKEGFRFYGCLAVLSKAIADLADVMDPRFITANPHFFGMAPFNAEFYSGADPTDPRFSFFGHFDPRLMYTHPGFNAPELGGPSQSDLVPNDPRYQRTTTRNGPSPPKASRLRGLTSKVPTVTVTHSNTSEAVISSGPCASSVIQAGPNVSAQVSNAPFVSVAAPTALSFSRPTNTQPSSFQAQAKKEPRINNVIPAQPVDPDAPRLTSSAPSSSDQPNTSSSLSQTAPPNDSRLNISIHDFARVSNLAQSTSSLSGVANKHPRAFQPLAINGVVPTQPLCRTQPALASTVHTILSLHIWISGPNKEGEIFLNAAFVGFGPEQSHFVVPADSVDVKQLDPKYVHLDMVDIERPGVEWKKTANVDFYVEVDRLEAILNDIAKKGFKNLKLHWTPSIYDDDIFTMIGESQIKFDKLNHPTLNP